MTSTVDTVKSSLDAVTTELALTLPYGPTLNAFRDFDGGFNEDDIETSEDLAQFKTLAVDSKLPFAEHVYTISQKRFDVKSKGTITESELVGIIANLSAVCVQMSKRAYASDEAEE